MTIHHKILQSTTHKNFIFFLIFLCIAYSCNHSSGFLTTDPNNNGLILPEGFGALVVADSIGKSRHLAVNDNGDIYVKLRYAKGTGSNVALRDTTGDGKADIITYFGDYKDKGSLANGMRIHKGYLYYSAARVVYRNKLVPGQLVPDTPMEVVLTDDHEHGIHWHITKPVSFDEKGYMCGILWLLFLLKMARSVVSGKYLLMALQAENLLSTLMMRNSDQWAWLRDRTVLCMCQIKG